MVKVVIIVLFFAIALFRWITAKGNSKASFLLVSLFVQTLPFGFGKALVVFLKGRVTEDYMSVRLGEFSNLLRLEMPLLFILLLFLFGLSRFRPGAFAIPKNKWLYILLFFCLISLLNPFNIYPTALLALIVPIFQFLLLFKFLESNFSQRDILRGIYDGLLVISLLELSLAICYPVLGLESVTTFFKGEDAFEWSQRRGMASAIGTFGHPGHLALYCLIFIFFFLSCYFNGYQKKTSLYLLLGNAMTLTLTFSRTAIICCVLIVPILALIQKKGSKVFSVKSITYFGLLSGVFLAVLYLSPIGYLFFESDSSIQINNRFIHWALGYQMWQKSPFLGVGINTHVYYMLTRLNATIDSPAVSFFIRSPIHNIHMIVLAETGLLGMSAWLFFFGQSIRKFYSKCRTWHAGANILNLTYVGVLMGVFIYGFFGWTPFMLEVYSLCMLFGYFANADVPRLKPGPKEPAAQKMNA